MPNGQQQVTDFELLPEEEKLAIINGPAFREGISYPEEEGDDVESETTDEENDQEGEDEADENAPQSDETTEDKNSEKKKSGVAKVIEQRNEARSERDRYAAELAQAQDRIRELTAQDERTQDEDLELVKLTTKETILDRDIKNAEEAEKRSFYKSNPQAERDREALEAILQEFPKMSYKDAYSFFLVKKGRAGELIAKDKPSKPNKFWVAGATSWSSNTWSELTTADYEAEMAKQIAAGKKTPFN